jgi:hypothetical protein
MIPMTGPGADAATLTTLPAPVIASTGHNVYVSGTATNLVGTPGRFTFSDPGGSNVVAYLYGFGFAGTRIPAGPKGTATIAVTPNNPAVIDLDVSAVDGSGDVSPPSEFQIETNLPPGNIANLAWWKLSAGHGTEALDATGHGHTAKLAGPASLGCGSAAAPDGYRCWLKLTGPDGQAVTPRTLVPLVGNDGSFTVSAWAKASGCGGTCAALSEDGTQVSGFALGYQQSCTAGGKTGPCWVFAMPATDQTTATVFTAASAPGTAHLHEWAELTGVFDATHGELSLYVNGRSAGQISGVEPWAQAAGGPMRLGAALPGGTVSSWDGQISNACVFYGPLASSDAKLLYTGDSTYPHNGCAALHAKYP